MIKYLLKPIYFLDYNKQIILKNFASNLVSLFFKDLKIKYMNYEINLLKKDKSAKNIFLGYLIHKQWKHEVYEQEIIKKLLSHYAHEKVLFIDVGASYGMFTYLASNFSNVTKIISIEAYKPVYEILCNNLKKNNISNVFSLNKVVSSVSDENYSIQEFNNSEWNRFIQDNKKNIIKSITLDEVIISNYNNENMIFIKMDIEGNEPNALKGLINSINKNYNLNIMLEFHVGVLEEVPGRAISFAKELFNLKQYSVYIIDVSSQSLNKILNIDEFSIIVNKLKRNNFPYNLFNILLVNCQSVDIIDGMF